MLPTADGRLGRKGFGMGLGPAWSTRALLVTSFLYDRRRHLNKLRYSLRGGRSTLVGWGADFVALWQLEVQNFVASLAASSQGPVRILWQVQRFQKTHG